MEGDYSYKENIESVNDKLANEDEGMYGFLDDGGSSSTELWTLKKKFWFRMKLRRGRGYQLLLKRRDRSRIVKI